MKRLLRNAGDAVPWLCLFALCAFSVWNGARVTANLDWPYDADAFRDVGIAQSILDGTYPEDTCYLGATQWYSPLAGAIVAAGSCITGAPPHVVDVRIGAYINVLVPIAFFAVAAALLGRWVALAALVCFLYVLSPAGFPQVSPSYSPWFFAPHFSQALFYATMLVYRKAYISASRSWQVAAGACLGIAFVGHTAPAVLLGCIAMLVTAFRLIEEWRKEHTWKSLRLPALHFLVLMLTAFLVSLPYSFPVLLHYQYRIVNPSPSRWLWQYLELAHLKPFLWSAFSVSNGIAYLGLLGLLHTRRKNIEKALIVSWIVVSGVFLAYSFLVQALERAGIQAPMIVPGYHYLLYLGAVKRLLMGYGLVVIVRLGADAVRAVVYYGFHRSIWTSLPRVRRVEHLAMLSIALFLVWSAYRPYMSYFRLPADPAWFRDYAPAHAWLRENATPQDVVLCDDILAMHVVAPANRKVVSTEKSYSNPYLDWQSRAQDRQAMLSALAVKNEAQFSMLAAEHKVNYYIIYPYIYSKGSQRLSMSCLRLVYNSGPIAIYRVSLE